MEENKVQLKSIWGQWWEPIRKWFYPSWLCYETTMHFYEYALSVHNYFINFKTFGTQTLAILGGAATFIVCFAFLTVPASIALFKFFKSEKTYNNPFEKKLKTYF